MEMKKAWTRPLTTVQQFDANEAISACGDSGVNFYMFKCTAPAGTLYYYPESDGNIDGVYTGTGGAWKLGSYHPCGASHNTETASKSAFYDGFVDYNGNGRQDDGEGVIV